MYCIMSASYEPVCKVDILAWFCATTCGVSPPIANTEVNRAGAPPLASISQPSQCLIQAATLPHISASVAQSVRCTGANMEVGNPIKRHAHRARFSSGSPWIQAVCSETTHWCRRHQRRDSGPSPLLREPTADVQHDQRPYQLCADHITDCCSKDECSFLPSRLIWQPYQKHTNGTLRLCPFFVLSTGALIFLLTAGCRGPSVLE